MLAFVGALALGASAYLGQTPQDSPSGPAFASKLKTLVVFKEGFGFYLREGSAKLEDGWATTNLVPQALGGTLWVYPKNPADRVDTIVLTKDNRVEFEKPDQIRTELANKVGLALRITTEGRQVVGRLTNLLDKMLLVQDPQRNYVAIEYQRIDAIALVDFPVKIKLRTAKPDSLADVVLAYVQEGVRWQPTYLLEMDGKKGRLTLRGTLLDLNEPLKDANVVFVVGAPSMVNRGTIDELLQGYSSGSMMGLKGSSIDFVTADAENKRMAGEADSRANRPGATGAPRGVGGGGFGGGFGSSAGGIPPITSDETGELQYYTKPGFSLRPGEKAMAMIFEAEIPVTPMFEWDADANAVQYILTLENKSGQPFTSGPVFVVENQRPVGQQAIQYTPPGGKAELRLAQGIGLKTDRIEAEIKRGDVFKVGQDNYLPIQIKGTFTLENFRKEPADVRIQKVLTGKLLDAGGGTVKDVQVARNGPNTVNRLEWRVSVPPGKKLEISYAYEAYTNLGR